MRRCVYCNGRGLPNTKKYKGWCCWAAWSRDHPVLIPRDSQ